MECHRTFRCRSWHIARSQAAPPFTPVVAACASHLQPSFPTFSPKTHPRDPPADLRDSNMCFSGVSDPTSRATRMAAWQANFERNVLGFSAAWSWVVMDRLGAPHWRQVGPRARAACVPPLSTHSIAHLRARLCWPLPLHPRASGRARAERKAAAHPVPHAPPARALRRPRRRRRGRLEWRRLRPLHGGRLTVGRRGAVTCVGQPPPGVPLGALLVRHGRRATGRRAAGRRRRRWRPRRGRRRRSRRARD